MILWKIHPARYSYNAIKATVTANTVSKTPKMNENGDIWIKNPLNR